MTTKQYTVVFVLAVILGGSPARTNTSRRDKYLDPEEYILPGSVMDDEAALTTLGKEANIVFELNLVKYLEEFPGEAPNADFRDQAFAVVGSVATLDASITFNEAVKNYRVISSQRAAGLPGRPRPMNDKLHNQLQGLNACRNVVWLLKEKLRNGVVKADASLMDKLEEAKLWLSTQTGGHLGQGMTMTLEKSGVMAKLETKWGKNSLKFRSFKAAAANGLDFGINAFNSVVSGIQLEKEVTDANILGLTSSLSAMAGDTTMGITQTVLTTGARASTAAGPIGYGIAAGLYIISYATGVASGLVGQEDLEPKDYVKAFLSPLIPAADFNVVVDTIDALSKGNIGAGTITLLTQTQGAALYMGYLYLTDLFTGSQKLTEYLEMVQVANVLLNREAHEERMRKKNEFRKKMIEPLRDLVQKLKPKKLAYAYPTSAYNRAYGASGWRKPEDLSKDFGIPISNLTNLLVFIATYTEDYKISFEYAHAQHLYPGRYDNREYTFVPAELLYFRSFRNSEPFLFIGNDEIDDVVKLDGNSEAYGLGGDDVFNVEHPPRSPVGPVKIDGGKGHDKINTTSGIWNEKAYPGVEYRITGGGPESDVIHGGYGNDFIIVENDRVSDDGGNNTILVIGSGDDLIFAGPGANLIFINKTGGTIQVEEGEARSKDDVWRSRRIVYNGDFLTTHGKVSQYPAVLCGTSKAHHDVLKMTNYKPRWSPSYRVQMIVFMFHGEEVLVPFIKTTPRQLFDSDGVKNVRDKLFNITRCTNVPGYAFLHRLAKKSEVFCPDAEKSQRIFYKSIERFELSRYTANLLFLQTKDSTIRHEVIGGPHDDYIVNMHPNIDAPLMVQLGGGTNRVYSGKGDDEFSLILDRDVDIIMDRGGSNTVAVTLPEWIDFEVVYIREMPDPVSSFFIYYSNYRGGVRPKVRLEYNFCCKNEREIDSSSVKFLFKERSTGRELIFKKLKWPGRNANDYLSRRQMRLESLYEVKALGSHAYDSIIESITKSNTESKTDA